MFYSRAQINYFLLFNEGWNKFLEKHRKNLNSETHLSVKRNLPAVPCAKVFVNTVVNSPESSQLYWQRLFIEIPYTV